MIMSDDEIRALVARVELLEQEEKNARIRNMSPCILAGKSRTVGQLIQRELETFLAENNMIHQIDATSLCGDIMRSLRYYEVYRLIPRTTLFFEYTEESDDNGNDVDANNAILTFFNNETTRSETVQIKSFPFSEKELKFYAIQLHEACRLYADNPSSKAVKNHVRYTYVSIVDCLKELDPILFSNIAMYGIDIMNQHSANTFFKYRSMINRLSNVIDNAYALIVKYSNVGNRFLDEESMTSLVNAEADMSSVCQFSHGGLFSSEATLVTSHNNRMPMIEVSKQALMRLSKAISQSEI